MVFRIALGNHYQHLIVLSRPKVMGRDVRAVRYSASVKVTRLPHVGLRLRQRKQF